MSASARIAGVILLAGAISFCTAIASGQARSRHAHKVTSTLDRKRTLPHRIRWIARPRMPRSSVARVEFVIDGKLRWIERKGPYVYGDDSDWLVTSWLAPGLHRFTVRVIPRRGATASRTTTARVPPALAPPAELANTRWSHLLKNQGELGSPPGTWTLHINDVGWRIDDPKGNSNLLDVAYFSP